LLCYLIRSFLPFDISKTSIRLPPVRSFLVVALVAGVLLFVPTAGFLTACVGVAISCTLSTGGEAFGGHVLAPFCLAGLDTLGSTLGHFCLGRHADKALGMRSGLSRL